ncbi:MAG: glucosamine-6-phosphate deaminase [Otoolea sp.]
MREFYVDNLNVKIFESRQEMGMCAGTEIAAYIFELLKEKETINVMFAAAPSQNETLETLCDQSIPWNRINAFHMDEYVGLEENHPAGFRNFLKRAIFDKFDFHSVNLIDGNAEDIESAMKAYDKLLRDNPLDVCILGIGENGHLAFNDPDVADFNDPVGVKLVKLDEKCRMQQVHDGCFQTIDQVPAHAITVTIPALCAATKMFCSVPAATKADAVKALVEGSVSENCPATILRRHNAAYLYLDLDSAKYI